MEQRSSKLDFLKTVAMIGVCYCHYGHFGVNTMDGSLKGGIKIIIQLFACTAVPIFFCINGYLSLEKNYSNEKMLHKAGNLLIKMMFWIPVTAILYGIIHEEKILEFEELLYRCWNWQGNGVQHLWFLFALLIIYLLYPFVNMLYRMENSKVKWFYYILGILFTFGNATINLAANIISYYLEKEMVYYTDTNFFHGPNFLYGWYSWCIVYFIIGCWLLKTKFSKKHRILSGLSIVVISVGYVWLCHTMSMYTGNDRYYVFFNGYNQVYMLILTIAIFILSDLLYIPGKMQKLLEITGGNTLGVLFLHRIWGEIFLKIFSNYGIDIRLGGVRYGILGAMLTWLFSLLSVLAMKRIIWLKKFL